MKKSCIIFFAFVMLFSFTANGAGIDKITEEKISETETRITVTGTVSKPDVFHPVSNEVTLEIFNRNATMEDFENASDKLSMIMYMDQTTADDQSGEYTFSWKMNGESGGYLIRLGYYKRDGEKPAEKVYDYVKPDDLIKLTEDVNNAESGAELGEIIERNVDENILKIDYFEKDNENNEAIYEYMNSKKNYSGISDICNMYFAGLINTQWKKSDGVSSFYENEKYADFTADYDDCFKMYNEYVKTNSEQNSVFDYVFKTSDITPENIMDRFIVSTVKTAVPKLNKNDVLAFLNMYNSIFKIDFSEYKKLDGESKKEYVLENMAKASINAIEDVKASFNFYTREAKKITTPKPNSGSNGGSSGSTYVPSSSSVNFSADLNTQAEKTATPIIFNDIDGVKWAKEAIDYLSARKIIAGTQKGMFEPDRPVKREEFVKMIAESLNLKPTRYTSGYSDVDDNAWYSDYVIAASEEGIVNGISSYEFGIGRDILRKDVAVIFSRLLGEENEENECGFSDVKNDYSFSAIGNVYRNGIMQGVDETHFCPEENLTRAQAAVCIYNFLINRK